VSYLLPVRSTAKNPQPGTAFREGQERHPNRGGIATLPGHIGRGFDPRDRIWQLIGPRAGIGQGSTSGSAAKG
jgi:hypothetical protein